MNPARLAYLDRAFKTLGLSLGRPEANEMSRIEGRFGLDETSHDPTKTVEDRLMGITQLDRRPLSGLNAQVIVALSQIAAAKCFGLPAIAADTEYLNLPALGRTAVRVILRNPSFDHALRVEAGGLEDVESYILWEITFARPECISLVGWAAREDVLGSTKVRIAAGGPQAHVIEDSKLHRVVDED